MSNDFWVVCFLCILTVAEGLYIVISGQQSQGEEQVVERESPVSLDPVP